MTVARLEAEMPMAELIEWQEFAALEPFGEHLQDLRAGTIAATVANVNRDPAKRRTPYSAVDFVPWNAIARKEAEPEKPLPKLTPAEEAAFLDAVFGF